MVMNTSSWNEVGMVPDCTHDYAQTRWFSFFVLHQCVLTNYHVPRQMELV
jgi:hypothetical protein